MKISLSFILCYLSFGVALISCSGDPAADAMRRELLRAKEMNREYVPFTTDSVMKEVVAYFDRHGTPIEKIEAHYLLGCVYRDLGEAPQALQCYQDAVNTSPGPSEGGENCNSFSPPSEGLGEVSGVVSGEVSLLIRIYGQMAELYDAQNLPSDEISAMQKIQHYALLEHDSLMYIRALELMTKPYYKLGDTTKVIETIMEAHRLYTERGDSQKAVNAFATLAHIKVKRGQLEEADRLLREFEIKTGLFDENGNIERGREMYYYIKGNYYLEAGKTDSAETFFRRLLTSPLPKQGGAGGGSFDADAYRGLLSVFQKRRESSLSNSDSIAKYARLFEAAVDSLNNKRRIETVHQMAALYNYHRFQQKADMEALAASEAKNRANVAVVLIVLISIATCTILIWYRKGKQKVIDKLSEECLVIGGLLAKARMELDEERKAADSYDSLETEMQEKLEEKSNEVKELEGRLQQLEEHYRSVTQLDSLEKKKNSEAVKAIRKRAEWKHGARLPSADEWIKLTNQFRLDFPYYYSTLTQGKKLSINELRTCMLLMLDFKEGEIAVLLDVKPQRVTNIKKRVNMKLFDDISATTLTVNIQAASSLV
ncbi:MAG: tetratricopeptide repeat protein [Prevotella sp.]|nr:tetratricopeptide repeat protein [Prevotella sp.]